MLTIIDFKHILVRVLWFLPDQAC